VGRLVECNGLYVRLKMPDDLINEDDLIFVTQNENIVVDIRIWD
jgi:hypothetical protein